MKLDGVAFANLRKGDTNFERVEDFHFAFNVDINNPDLIHKVDYVRLRINLIEEEVAELKEELWNCCQLGKISPNLLKEIADVLYVTYGLAVGLGLDADAAFKRVHESNMSKLDDEGKPIYREDGKVLKGPHYKAPYLGDLV